MFCLCRGVFCADLMCIFVGVAIETFVAGTKGQTTVGKYAFKQSCHFTYPFTTQLRWKCWKPALIVETDESPTHIETALNAIVQTHYTLTCKPLSVFNECKIDCERRLPTIILHADSKLVAIPLQREHSTQHSFFAK